MKRNVLRFLPVILFVSILVTGWLHRFWLFDSYRLIFYEPSSRIVELADRSGMSDLGKRLFYGAQPQLLLEDAFDQECQFAELGLVLGCYKSSDIFILDVTDEQLESVEPVTAAHEMLHVVYARLNQGEIDELRELLDRQFELITNERIISEIDGYRNDPGADLHNEMHSIFGTEQDELIPELEEIYAPYFDDRSLVIAESKAYEKVFTELEDEIEAFDAELATLRTEINTLEEDIANLNTQINTDRARLEALLESGNVPAYNAAVPGFNSTVNSHNAKVEQVKQKIKEYNEIVAERNANVAAKNNLIKSLDSNVQTIE